MDRPELHEQRVANLIAAFETKFGRRPEGIAEAPGRVNLIGEHVDYNDGLVLPFAIDRTVMCAWGDPPWTPPAEDELEILRRVLELPADYEPQPMTSTIVHSLDSLDATVEVLATLNRDASGNFPPMHEVDDGGVSTLADMSGGWGLYVEAVVRVLREFEGYEGTNAAIEGNVPQGAGLSSSAALEIAIAGALRAAFELPLDDVRLAKLCQRAENEYVGVQCGIMDQFASALSKKDHALLIDCRTLAREDIPLRLNQASLSLVVINSGVKRELASTAYNERRRECDDAVAILRERLERPELASLRDVTAADLDRVTIDNAPLRRARHVVSEIARVAACVEALRADDFEAVGRLMLESHISLRDDFEVSSPELDLLVGLATAQPSVLGARLTGAGFGGCTINVVRTDALAAFEREVVDVYRARTGLPAEAYAVSPQDGLRTWRL